MSKCVYCGKTVYQIERQPGTPDGKSWHARCWQAFQSEEKKKALASTRLQPTTPQMLGKTELSEKLGELPNYRVNENKDGAAVAVAVAVGGGDAAPAANPAGAKFCAGCGTARGAGAFCAQCGAKFA